MKVYGPDTSKLGQRFFKEVTFVSSGFSAEGTLISAPVVPAPGTTNYVGVPVPCRNEMTNFAELWKVP